MGTLWILTLALLPAMACAQHVPLETTPYGRASFRFEGRALPVAQRGKVVEVQVVPVGLYEAVELRLGR